MIPGTPLTIYANDNGQLQVVVRRQRDRRVLPAVAGAGERGVEHRPDRAAQPGPFDGLRLPRQRRSTRTRLPRRSPATAAPPTRGRSRRATARTARLESEHPRRPDAHLRQRLDGRRRPLHVVVNNSDSPTCASALYEAADLYVAGNDRASASSTQARRARSAASTRRRAAPGASSRSRRGSTTRRRTTTTSSASIGNSDQTRRRTSTTRSTRRCVDNGVGVQWDFASLRERYAPDLPRSSGASAASSPSTLALASADAGHRPDRDGRR